MKEQVERITRNNLEGTDMMGVREMPYFNIPIDRVVWPLLHALIGIGNNLLQWLVELGDSEVQCLPGSEIKMIEETKTLKVEVAKATENKKEWEANEKPTFKVLQREATKLEKWIAQNGTHVDVTTKKTELSALLNTVKQMQSEIDEYSSIIKTKGEKIKLNESKLDGFKKARKRSDNSVSTGIDKILTRHGVNRAAYHGGDLQGKDVIKMMEESTPIMIEVCELFLSSMDEEKCQLSRDQIIEYCNEFAQTLRIWDAVFACCQRSNPQSSDIEELGRLTEFGMKKVRELQMSVTPKLHGTEKHLKQQVRDIPLFRKVFEYWMEKYHQDGVKFDIMHRHSKSMEELARMRITRDAINRLPEVKQLIEEKRKDHTGTKRKVTTENEAAKRLEKQRRRNVFTGDQNVIKKEELGKRYK